MFSLSPAHGRFSLGPAFAIFSLGLDHRDTDHTHKYCILKLGNLVLFDNVPPPLSTLMTLDVQEIMCQGENMATWYFTGQLLFCRESFSLLDSWLDMVDGWLLEKLVSTALFFPVLTFAHDICRFLGKISMQPRSWKIFTQPTQWKLLLFALSPMPWGHESPSGIQHDERLQKNIKCNTSNASIFRCRRVPMSWDVFVDISDTETWYN